uniref:Viral late gene transcription factor 3 zinc ribbon domain-containing protein n=1 Tax=viral metagenome TaxID=1070528 RepID=A0A6C0HJV0_9ZZZZ
MSEGAFFKVKSTKRSNPEARTTLDAIHNQKIQNMMEEKNQLGKYKEERSILQKKLAEPMTDMDSWRLERDIDSLDKKIKSLEDGSELMDYYLRTGDILYHYYDIQEQIQKGTATFAANKAKPGSILAILEGVAEEKKDSIDPFALSSSDVGQEKSNSTEKKSLQRNQLLNDYLQIEDPAMGRNITDEYDDPWTNCEQCGNEMIMCLNEANLTCSKCGHQEFILVDSDKPSYKDPPREICYYAYKKINHFNEWLAQFQAKESTEIPADIYDEILVQLKKERITNMGSLKPTKMREILRKMKCSKYYEHIPHIINRLNGQNAPFMSREDEEKLRHMFREIQPSFKKHCPKGRRNFLSYGYVLYKFCELLEMDEYLCCFPLLKNRDKLYLQDKTWELICRDQGWQYLKTV